jgi:hypothetical protein
MASAMILPCVHAYAHNTSALWPLNLGPQLTPGAPLSARSQALLPFPSRRSPQVIEHGGGADLVRVLIVAHVQRRRVRDPSPLPLPLWGRVCGARGHWRPLTRTHEQEAQQDLHAHQPARIQGAQEIDWVRKENVAYGLNPRHADLSMLPA